MKYFLLTALMILSISFVSLPVRVSAQSTGGLLPPTCDGPDCTFNSVVAMAQEIATAIVKVGLFVAPLIFAYAGYLLVASGSNPGNRAKAAGIFKNVVIGLFTMLAAWVIVNLVLTALVSQSVRDSLPWAQTQKP